MKVKKKKKFSQHGEAFLSMIQMPGAIKERRLINSTTIKSTFCMVINTVSTLKGQVAHWGETTCNSIHPELVSLL